MGVIKYIISKEFRNGYSKDLRDKVNNELDSNEKIYKRR